MHNTLAPIAATLAPATTLATLAPLAWGTVSVKTGMVSQHVAHSATAQALAPKTARMACAMSHDTVQLQNGNYSAVREALALFKGKALATLQTSIVAALSITTDDGATLAPVIQWDNVRVKTHAIAIARAIVATDLKGKKATMRDTMQAWVNAIDANS